MIQLTQCLALVKPSFTVYGRSLYPQRWLRNCSPSGTWRHFGDCRVCEWWYFCKSVQGVFLPLCNTTLLRRKTAQWSARIQYCQATREHTRFLGLQQCLKPLPFGRVQIVPQNIPYRMVIYSISIYIYIYRCKILCIYIFIYLLCWTVVYIWMIHTFQIHK